MRLASSLFLRYSLSKVLLGHADIVYFAKLIFPLFCWQCVCVARGTIGVGGGGGKGGGVCTYYGMMKPMSVSRSAPFDDLKDVYTVFLLYLQTTGERACFVFVQQ